MRRQLTLVVIAVSVAMGCGDVNAGLERMLEARHLSADLLVQFAKASDAANLAVMAETDTASVAYEREAVQANETVQKDIDALQPLLQELRYDAELRQLQTFVTRFTGYRQLDRRILDLAVENTNFKARQLSFGPAQTAADAFRDALDGVSASVTGQDKWRVEALAATAVAAVREIQALQAPHIAESDDAVMTKLEKRMAGSEAAAKSALATLKTAAPPASRSRLDAATAALEQFADLNAQIIVLSRRNSDVNSLALSLNEKRALVSSCDEALNGLRDALSKRGYPRGRY